MLEYVTLGILCVGLTLVFFTFTYIHDIPYEIAKKRNHPQVEAIHIACVISLFTLHALWPLVYIWAVIKPSPLRVAITDGSGNNQEARIRDLEEQLATLNQELKSANAQSDPTLEARLSVLEASQLTAEKGAS